ncbi:uncharacterized protein DC041_0002892 [Schistosoma bovis]|uniref:Monocyte to macrophage differentiation protein n=1 Tax=Schistosoma bovis TaxID=6184 RepID=A0A430QCV4_SCHBO|nr:uncharacterized protein DC041_0002892 [Schistosoma bovis]
MHEQSGLPLLFTGAFVYLSGVIFFKLDGHIPLAHAIWHCCHEQSGLPLLFTGAFVYLSGVIFFKLDGHIPLAHAIWHCCVFIATFLQFNAVDTFLLTN